ncbi:T9SS type A sorting domain-containing protein [Bacteroidales bacterium OttesenSCG-928-I21]|nr:T9SS type A sorting domain-containing protein [Bacteroidales bacterium OttesenSCG-928-I21]
MKTKVLVLLLLTIFSTQLHAQYQSFFGENTTKYNIFTPSSSKNIGLWSTGETIEYIFIHNDTTIINDTVYYQAYNQYYLREDTVNGQLFRYVDELNKEYLMCDMSLEVGDTFSLPDWGTDARSCGLNIRDWTYQEEGLEIIVDSIVYINGKKIIYFPCIENNIHSPHYNCMVEGTITNMDKVPFTFIEGIGPAYGALGYSPSTEGYLGVLLCIEKDNILTYMLSSELGCFKSIVSVENLKENSICIFPNPANDILNIETPENIEIISINICTMDGKIIENNTVSFNAGQLNISKLQTGSYILNVNTDKGNFNKLIIKN